MFNYLFIKKAIDASLEKTANEMEACSKLLVMCTQEYNFGNNDFGYAFDDLLWVKKLKINEFCYRTNKSTQWMCRSFQGCSLSFSPRLSMKAQ